MRLTFANFVLIVCLILSGAWVLDGYQSGQMEHEALIVFFSFLAAIVTANVFTRRSTGDDQHVKVKQSEGASEPSAHDIALFADFQRELPIEPTMRLLRDLDFGNSFWEVQIEPLYRFSDSWDSVDKEFIDSRLETKKKALFESAARLANEISGRTVAVGNLGPNGEARMISVYSDSLRSASGGVRPQHVKDDAIILNELSTEFVPIYDDFVRYAKKRLQL